MTKKQDEFNAYDKKHQRRLSAYQKQIDNIFNTAAKEAAAIGAAVDLRGTEAFTFTNYPLTRKRIDNLLKSLARSITLVVVNGIKAEWDLANSKNDELVKSAFCGKTSELPAKLRDKYFSSHVAAKEAFLARKVNGLSLSERVWNYTEGFKEEIEMGLDLGIREGKDAASMARDLKQYLRHPDTLFRRVRDEYGVLHLSKRAKTYHPGRGAYRSSYKNARRLAATETNIAYRTADYERWQDIDFVVGIEISLSNNHTCLGADGEPHPFHDICDELAGRYPKDFKFVGWHPHCRCRCIPILMTEEELMEGNRRIMRGEEPSVHSENEVTERNANGLDKFNQWIDDNRERAKGWETMPYFVRDNPNYVANFRVDTYSASERKFTMAYHTSPAMKQSLATYLQNKYPDMPNTEKAALCDYTRGDVSDFRHLNKELMNDNLSEFNIAFSELLSDALSKLPTEEATTYRTIRLNKTNLEVWKQQAEKRAETTFQGFTSTSDSFGVVQDMIAKKAARKKKNETDVLLVIKGKTGHRIEDFSKFHKQHELLFDKGMRLKYERFTETDGLIVFRMTEI